jgi:hypothetical protein
MLRLIQLYHSVWSERRQALSAKSPLIYGPIENFPSNVLGEQRKLALLFKTLAILRTDAPLFKKVETLLARADADIRDVGGTSGKPAVA